MRGQPCQSSEADGSRLPAVLLHDLHMHFVPRWPASTRRRIGTEGKLRPIELMQSGNGMDTESFIDALNEDLRTEYQSIVQYISHAATVTGAEFLSVIDELRDLRDLRDLRTALGR